MTTKQKTILLIDDDPLIIRMYQNKLAEEGYQILTAFNGESGLALAQKETPNLIFLDLMMPKMSGAEVLKALKKDEVTKNIPVVILSNLDGKDEHQYAEDAGKIGAAGYLVKAETDLKQLAGKVKEILGE